MDGPATLKQATVSLPRIIRCGEPSPRSPSATLPLPLALRERTGVTVQATTNPAPATPPALHGQNSSPRPSHARRVARDRYPRALTAAGSRLASTAARPDPKTGCADGEQLTGSRPMNRGFGGHANTLTRRVATTPDASARQRPAIGCGSAVDRPIPWDEFRQVCRDRDDEVTFAATLAAERHQRAG